MQPLPRQLEVHRISRRIVARDASARLQRHDDDPVVGHVDFDDMRSALHRRGDGVMVATLHVIGQVARRFVPQLGRTRLQRRAAVNNRRQRLVIDLDQLRRLARDLRAVGDDKADRIADMADTA